MLSAFLFLKINIKKKNTYNYVWKLTSNTQLEGK